MKNNDHSINRLLKYIDMMDRDYGTLTINNLH